MNLSIKKQLQNLACYIYMRQAAKLEVVEETIRIIIGMNFKPKTPTTV